MNSKQLKIAFIIGVLFISHLTIYTMGLIKGINKSVELEDYALEAAAQSYKNTMPNDTNRLDYSGTEKFSERPDRFILPETLRTEGLQKEASQNSESKTTRKRTF